MKIEKMSYKILYNLFIAYFGQNQVILNRIAGICGMGAVIDSDLDL